MQELPSLTSCDDTYIGEGQIENFTEIVVSFEGNDCEGPHTGGRIRLVKWNRI